MVYRDSSSNPRLPLRGKGLPLPLPHVVRLPGKEKHSYLCWREQPWPPPWPWAPRSLRDVQGVIAFRFQLHDLLGVLADLVLDIEDLLLKRCNFHVETSVDVSAHLLEKKASGVMLAIVAMCVCRPV